MISRVGMLRRCVQRRVFVNGTGRREKNAGPSVRGALFGMSSRENEAMHGIGVANVEW